ncbi:MAG: hypothetical protein JOY88_10745 [Pelomonas sp.]|nr:hypothetical protein [Roseateles sp.]
MQRPDVVTDRACLRCAALASSALGCAALLVWHLRPGVQTYETGIGERRIVMLANGT